LTSLRASQPDTAACSAALQSMLDLINTLDPRPRVATTSPTSIGPAPAPSPLLMTTANVNASSIPLEIYTDTVQNFIIGHPPGWARDATVTHGARFVLGDHVLTLAFADAKGATAAVFTKAKVAAEMVRGSVNVKLLRSKSLPSAIIMDYDFTSTTSPVFIEHGRRYYIPFANGRMAMVTVTGRADKFRNIIVQTIANSLRPVH